MRRAGIAIVSVLLVFNVSCGGGGGGSGNDEQAALVAEANSVFPYSDTDPLKVFYSCVRAGSSLEYNYDFDGNGNLDVRLVSNIPSNVTLSGTYQYSGGNITIDPIATLTAVSEMSSNVQTFMGMITSFSTYTAASPSVTQMLCIALGHRYGNPSLDSYRHYSDCDEQNFNSGRYDNAFELTARSSVHTNLAIPGAIFRQRNWFGGGAVQGWGFYRRTGDTYYAYFYNQFDDANLIKGQFQNTDLRITVPQIGINCSQ